MIILTEKDVMDHYMNNLRNKVLWWQTDLKDLLDQSEKIKETKDFKDFCMKKFSQWFQEVGILFLYFKMRWDK